MTFDQRYESNMFTVQRTKDLEGVPGMLRVSDWHSSKGRRTGWSTIKLSKASKLGKEYKLKIVRQDKARTVILDILNQLSSLTTQDSVIFSSPQKYSEAIYISECPKWWSCQLLYRKRLSNEVTRFNEIQKRYLDEKFNLGQKLHPALTSRGVRKTKT